MGIRADCERTVQEAIDGLEGLDVIVSNAVRLAKRGFHLLRWRTPSSFVLRLMAF